MNPAKALTLLCLFGILLLPSPARPHGSVTAEDDLCVISIGFYTAHFKVFQPRNSGSNEFCEDLPATGESIFVMEYLHDILGTVPIEFRIIENPTGLGKYTRLADIEALGDLAPFTVFHAGPAVAEGVFTITHDFAAEGDFVGVVTARHPEKEERYMAVFPFRVGSVDWGWVPWIAGLALLAQFGYWFANGTLRRWHARVLLLPLCLVAALASERAQAQEPVLSESGAYRAVLRSEVEPVPLNRIHSWIIHLETAEGEAVENAELSLDGGMPEHDHGLPTAPSVTEYLGDGDYRVEGLRFHMMGDWELVLDIAHEGSEDRITIPFTL